MTEPQPERTPRGPSVAMPLDDFRSILSAVETAYEAAWRLADIGRLDFSPFEGLPRALRVLRRHRDGLS